MTDSQRRKILRFGLPFGLAVVLLAALGSWLSRGQAEAVNTFAQCATQGYLVTDTNPPTCSNGHQTFVGPTSKTAEVAPGETVPFLLQVAGDTGGRYPQRQEIITSQADWQRYWAQVHAGLPTLPPILPIDFSNSDILALSEGVEQTTGYNLKINGITMSAAGTTVDVTRTVPTVTCAVSNTPSDRYYIAKTTKLTAPVSFRISTEYHRCK